jgi:hypothetical protein
MVALTDRPAQLAPPPTPAGLSVSAASNAGIVRYLEAGERMLVLMEFTWKLCAVLAAVIVVAWVFGVLPGAAKLF